MAIRNISDNWAYDIAKNPIDVGQIKDVDVINQSIEMILGTTPGERIFNPSFGFGLQYKIFNNMTNEEGEQILDQVYRAITRWEDRITVDERNMRLIANPNQNSIILIIPYTINRNQISSVFKKKIYSN